MAGRDHRTPQPVRRLPRTRANPHVGFRRDRAARTCASANAAGSRSTRLRPSRSSGSRGAPPAVFMPVTGVGPARPGSVPAARPRSLLGSPPPACPGANVGRIAGTRIGAPRSSLELSSSHSRDSPSASDCRSVRPEASRVSSDRRPPRMPPLVASRRDDRPCPTSPPSRPRRPSGRALRSPNRPVGPSPPHRPAARPLRRVSSPRLRPRRRQARLPGHFHNRRPAFWRRHCSSGSTGTRRRASGARPVSRGKSRPCLALGTT